MTQLNENEKKSYIHIHIDNCIFIYIYILLSDICLCTMQKCVYIYLRIVCYYHKIDILSNIVILQKDRE